MCKKVISMKKRKWLLIYVIIIGLILVMFSFFILFPQQKYSNSDFDIDTYVSNVDKDNDGIDDQTDILNQAKEYIKTKPKYKSKYYATGYPDDEYGVCTDVVAFSLKGAGYDLMELVYHHIQEKNKMRIIELL